MLSARLRVFQAKRQLAAHDHRQRQKYVRELARWKAEQHRR